MKKLKKISVIGIGASGRNGFIIKALPQPWVDANGLKVGDMVVEATSEAKHGHKLILDARKEPRAGIAYVVQKNLVLSISKQWCDMHGVKAKDKLQAYIDEFDRLWLEPA